MANRAERRAQGEGLLVLFLVIVAMSYLHSAFSGTTVSEGSCGDAIYVEAEGAVRHPGVYPLCGDGDLAGLIEMAGGLEQEDYNPPAFNDIHLETGVRVTFKEDNGGWGVYQDDIPAFYRVTLGLPISLNKESAEGLTAIPGIGPKLAGAIVVERDKRGGFEDLSEIMDVPGIGDKTYKKIAPYVTL